MRDRGWIVSGLLVFLVLITFPIWYDLAAGKSSKAPSLILPSGEKECVAPISYMKTSHMVLLNDWRDQAVRNGARIHIYNSRTYAISLAGTCLNQCHADKAGFCDRCHAYNGVQDPSCWDCHVDPWLARQPAQRAGATRQGERDGH